MSSKVQSDLCSGGAIWWMLMGWRPGEIADQLPLPMIVKRGWSGFPVRRAI